MPRRIPTTAGGWITLKSAQRLAETGRARFHTPALVEVFIDLGPKELNEALRVSHRPRQGVTLLCVPAAVVRDQHWIDLRPCQDASDWVERQQ